MARRNSSFGFLGRFGRSQDLLFLDAALRALDIHPALCPDGVKLVIVNLMKDRWPDGEPPAEAYPPVAELFGYCMVGPDLFGQANGYETRVSAEHRLEQALEHEGSLEAQLVLLALHSKLISPKTVERFGLEVASAGT